MDPYDGVEFRWNPVRRAPCPVRFESFALTLRLPGYVARGQFKANPPNAAGDYPVDRRELRQRIAPCLVHRLDAFFAGLVIERLAAARVHDVVSLHDCWLVPGDPLSVGVLKAAIADAGAEWLRGLGPIYERLIHYLGTDETYGPFVHAIRDQWQARVKAERWPVFAFQRDVLAEQEPIEDFDDEEPD